LMRDWKLFSNGAVDETKILDGIASIIGEKPIEHYHQPRHLKGRLGFDNLNTMAQNWQVQRSTFSEFCQKIKRDIESPSGDVLYMASDPIPLKFPELMPCLTIPDYIPRDRMTEGAPRLWIGNGGHTVSAHFDVDHNTLCLLSGEKRLTLFPPDQLPNMYLAPIERAPAGSPISMVNIKEPDFKRFPRFKAALERAVHVEMRAGDALFLPSFWWHEVDSVGLNIMINFWWSECPDADLDALKNMLECLAIARRMPRHRREIMRTFYDHFVFDNADDPFPSVPPEHHGMFAENGIKLRGRLLSLSLASLGLAARRMKKRLFPS
jgi:hypothetical protein